MDLNDSLPDKYCKQTKWLTSIKLLTKYFILSFLVYSNSVYAQFGGFEFIGASASASSAGDFNGDGFPDAIIGSFDDGAYVIFGSDEPFPESLNTNLLSGYNGFIIAGLNQDNSYFGRAVTSIGDMNNDGKDDIAVGGPSCVDGDNQDIASGCVFVIFGTSERVPPIIYPENLEVVTGFKIKGVEHGDLTGYSLAGSNLNNDEFGDLIIGAPSAADGAGQVFVLYGSSELSDEEVDLVDLLPAGNPSGEHGLVISSTGTSELLGHSVTALGDINQDGFHDFSIGTKERIYVIYGPSTEFGPALDISGLSPENGGDGSVGIAIETSPPFLGGVSVNGIILGSPSISNAGDINGDGIIDLIVGNPAYSSDGLDHNGAVYLIYGTMEGYESVINLSQFSSAMGTIAIGEFQIGWAGASVAGIGDFNSDGIDDVVIGAPGSGELGESYFIDGAFLRNNDMLNLNGETDVDHQSFAHFGSSVSALGDFNGDEISDFLVTSYSSGFQATTYFLFGYRSACPGEIGSAILDNKGLADPVSTVVFSQQIDLCYPEGPQWFSPKDLSVGQP